MKLNPLLCPNVLTMHSPGAAQIGVLDLGPLGLGQQQLPRMHDASEGAAVGAMTDSPWLRMSHGKSINAFLVTNTAEYAHPMLQYTHAIQPARPGVLWDSPGSVAWSAS